MRDPPEDLGLHRPLMTPFSALCAPPPGRRSRHPWPPACGSRETLTLPCSVAPGTQKHFTNVRGFVSLQTWGSSSSISTNNGGAHSAKPGCLLVPCYQRK